MAKEKMQMEVGKRYKGYGVLNEYGEYLFTPCQKLEPSEKNMKIVRSNGSATLYESKNNFRLSVNVPKKHTRLPEQSSFYDSGHEAGNETF